MTKQINWKEEVKKYQDDFLEDLKELLRIDSVRNDDEATDEFPVGPGPAKALHKVLEIGKRDGFETKQLENWAGHIEYGDGDEILGVLGHVDVVPVGSGWNTDPFDPVIKDGKLYARGSSDDKGPTMAAYYALKIIKDLDLPVNKKIRVIIGTDEESEWQGLAHYLENEKMPDLGFSPDGNFPIINGEKGNYEIDIETKASNEGDLTLVLFEAGLRSNMVPQDATAKIATEDPEALRDAFDAFISDQPVEGNAEIDSQTVTLNVVGKAAHGSKPQIGVNAATYLAVFLNTLDLGGDAKTFTNLVETYLHDDPYGEKLGVAQEDDVMGNLTSNPGVFRFEDGDKGLITVNMRYAVGDNDMLTSQVTNTLTGEDIKIHVKKGKVPHYVPGDDPLVQTLLDVYARQTGFEAHEQVIGGGTYGRLLNRGVAFGALFP
ncbi:MAG TPA: dipeptidase PepV, partial [Alloiococcus sp.]|nr:dipeptidase PepV [Alloiococcus sp.]